MAPHNEKQRVLKEAGDAFVKDRSAIARSKALQYAVSHGVRQAQLHQQQAAQPQQPSIVCWKRFLPQEQLRVLLVEDDDSTGHVVTALLRNCGYEVTLAANGPLAWELLMDQTNHLDLVLTEVVMPGLSGISLLTRIMNHEPLKHVPVIMMSSHDSMGLVFNCLSKGAVDFLVKPVRKNELKNLWQHVWRRCHNSSGSGSGSACGSGSPMQKIPQPCAAAEAENDGSSDESDSVSSELNLDGGSDNGSGTQSLWTKRAVKVERSREGILGGSNPHSTIQSKNGCLMGDDYQKNDDVSLNITKANSGGAVKEQPFFDNDQMDLNSRLDVSRTIGLNARDTGLCDEPTDSALPCVNQQTMEMVNDISIRGQESADEQQEDNEDADNLLEKHASNSPSSKDKTLSDFSSPLLLNLSLKRPLQAASDAEREVQGGLKRSCSSAFSRYNNTSTANLATKNNPPSYQHGSFGLPTSKLFSSIGTDEVIASPIFGGILHHRGNQSSSNVDKLLPGKHGAISCLAKEGAHASSCPGLQMHFRPPPGMSVDPNLTTEWGPSVENIDAQEFLQSTKTNHDSQVHHHHHHHHHHIEHHYHHHQEQHQQHEDSTVLNVGPSAPRCASSKMEKALEGINRQSGSCNGHGSNGNGAVSMNASATGSNYGSNGDQSAAAETGNIDRSGQTGVDGGAMGTAHGILMGADESRHARREAALTKFRQKRKERCFEKKVRYQSRKRLAEQRPRVRGQFVRRSVK